MKEYSFEFDIGDEVEIVKFGIKGFVNALWTPLSKTIQYDIEYVTNDGSVLSRWFSAPEIKLIKSKEN